MVDMVDMQGIHTTALYLCEKQPQGTQIYFGEFLGEKLKKKKRKVNSKFVSCADKAKREHFTAREEDLNFTNEL